MKRKRIFERIRWFFGRLWFGGGVVCFIIAIGFSIRTLVFLHFATITQGKVIDLVPERNQEDGTINYAAIFSFTAQDGKTYSVKTGVATNPPEFEVGQTVRIIYHERNPEKGKIDAFWQLWFLALLLAGLGAFFSAAGGLFLLWERRSKRQLIAASATS